jgi:hypothetical protein
VKSCSLYATSSSFGLDCVTGHGTTATQTVQAILGKGKPAPTCWDELISPADLAQKYDYVENPDAPYYLHSCLTGLKLTSSLYNQPDLQLNQQVIEIPRGTADCPTKKPFTEAMTGTCVMTLTGKQRVIVSATDLAGGQIPGITIVAQPSTKVRTNEAVAYVDATTDADGARVTRTPDYTVGGVTLWAQMGAYKIFPYGPDGLSKSCNGTERVTETDTPATKPDACWWTYPLSSAGQPGQVYPFRAEADWTVFYRDAAGTHTFAQFKKYDDLTLPVSDIETIVIN